MTWQSAGVWGGKGGSGSALVGGFGSWTCIYCSVAPSHRNKPFLIDGTLSPAASQRRNQISGTSVSSETKKKKKFRLFLAVTRLAPRTFNPPALDPAQPDCRRCSWRAFTWSCGIIPRGSPSCVCFSVCFMPEFHKAKLKVPRMFSQLLWMHDYHTFHGNWAFACANDSQEIFICIETCRICTSNCNNCMWKGRCKAIHTLALFIHNWIHELSRSERISLTSAVLSLT